ncbi:hypothetical protein EBU24_03995 [bacterium]|nr:hypothetical protein [bacterium]
MKVNFKLVALSAILLTSSLSKASQMQCAVICAQEAGAAGVDMPQISSTDEVFTILVEIITGKREMVFFERIVAHVGDDSLKEKLTLFFKEIKKLVGKERINKLRVIACRHLGVGATTSLTGKLLRVKSQIKEALFHMFVDQSNI